MNDIESETEKTQPATKETMQYLDVEGTATDEYDDTLDIFSMEFLWLFLGGVGGPFEIRPKRRHSELGWKTASTMKTVDLLTTRSLLSMFSTTSTGIPTPAKEGTKSRNSTKTLTVLKTSKMQLDTMTSSGSTSSCTSSQASKGLHDTGEHKETESTPGSIIL